MTTTTTRPRRAAVLALGWTAVAALIVYATWNRGIAMDLMLAAMSVVGLFSHDAVLPFQPDWLGAALRATATVAAAYLAWRLIRYHRVTRGACGRCGRSATAADPSRRRALALWAAYVSILPAAGYAALKITWAFGGTIGLADPSVFAGIKPWTPGFADTGVMALIGIGVALAMAHRRPRPPRWLLLTPTLIGLAMLIPVSILGTAGNISGANAAAGFLSTMSAWVLWFVYGCFTVWAVCLSIVTVEYHYGTRGRCATCGRG